MNLAEVTDYLSKHPAKVAEFRSQALRDLEAVISEGRGEHALAINTVLYELISARIDHSLKIRKGLVIARMLGRHLGRPPMAIPPIDQLFNGMSHAEAAELFGVSTATIKRWRRKKRGERGGAACGCL